MAVKKEAQKMTELRKFNVLSVGKITAFLGAVFGFLSGLLISFLWYKISSMPDLQQMPGFTPITASQLIALPFWYLILFGIISGIFGILCALIYNLIARTGGLKFELK